MKRWPLVAVAFASALSTLSIAPAALAQAYPSKPIRIVVPYLPGGFSDVVARVVAKLMQERAGRPVLVENRPGRDGILGTQAVARAEPDGYTLLLGDTSPLILAPLLNKDIPYDPINDFTRIAALIRSNSVLVAPAGAPFATLNELIAYARANPDKVTFGSSNVGQQIVAEQLKQQAGIGIRHIPYKGAPQVLQDLFGGHLSMAMTSMLNYTNLKGKLVGLALAGRVREAEFPELPTLVESGYPGIISEVWLGLLGPKGLSAEVRDYLVRAAQDASKQAELQAFVRKTGNYVEFFAGDAFDKRIIDQRQALSPVIKSLNLKAGE
jgi:tripartite-type tricarboxylate transporter receptor subunit TctC